MHTTNLVSDYSSRIGRRIESLAEEIHTVAVTCSANPKTIWRIKKEETLLKKLHLKGTSDILSVHDIYGIRVLVNSHKEIYCLLEQIALFYKGEIVHDYIKNPKTRQDVPGKKLRLITFVANIDTVPFEIQITTKKYNRENEKLHELYHSRKYSGL